MPRRLRFHHTHIRKGSPSTLDSVQFHSVHKYLAIGCTTGYCRSANDEAVFAEYKTMSHLYADAVKHDQLQLKRDTSAPIEPMQIVMH
jgi:hypothetical protein